MESSKEILNNFYVLQSIFHYLDFKEHLKLIKICTEFEDAIVYGVWRWMYKNLYIQQSSTGNFVLLYNAENNVETKQLLTSEELLKILHHTSTYIQKLELKDIQCLENITSLKYNNLTELKLLRTVVENAHLQQVAKNCLNLQRLSVIEFTDDRNQSNIRPNVFAEMKALNKLEINDIGFTAWNYFDIQQLFYPAHLKTLIINIDIRDSNDNNGNNNNSTEPVYNIEDLRIRELPFLLSRNVCFIENLKRFENLKKLSITLFGKPDSITDNVLTHINNACPELYELSFSYCELSFNEFPHMNNLMHLTLDFCKNLSLENFDEIFRKLKLKFLILGGIQMRNEAEDISDYNYTSKTLETLILQGPFIVDIVPTFVNRQHKFENVSKLTVKKSLIFRTGSTELCFSHNFPNLQELIMDYFYISSEDILCLKDLKVLQFSLFNNMSWSYLKILFQHPTLIRITITPRERLDFEMHYEPLPNCCKELTTKLEYLCLPSVVYESALSFWPDFRQRNQLLKLEIIDCRTLKRRPVPM